MAGTAAVFAALTAGMAASTWQALRARGAERAAVAAETRARQERDDAVRERNRARAAERISQQERNRAVLAQEEAQAERSHAVEASGRARTQAAIARAVRDFLQSDLLAQSSAQQQAARESKPDPDLKVRTALDRAAARVPERFHGQPLVEASVRQTIGAAYQDLGLYAEARTQFERVVQLRTRALGARHESSLDALRQLAQDTMLMGKYPEAEGLYQQVIAGLAHRRGPTDAVVLAVQAELVELDLQMGRYQVAEALIRKTLDAQRRVLGADHPATLSTLAELGRAQISQGEYPAGEATLRSLLVSLERTKGAEHPDTLSIAIGSRGSARAGTQVPGSRIDVQSGARRRTACTRSRPSIHVDDGERPRRDCTRCKASTRRPNPSTPWSWRDGRACSAAIIRTR